MAAVGMNLRVTVRGYRLARAVAWSFYSLVWAGLMRADTAASIGCRFLKVKAVVA